MLQNVYFVCAALGGGVLLIQTLGALFGLGHGDVDAGVEGVHDAMHDGEAHVDGDTFVKFFTLKTIVAFLTFFGLAGLAAERAELAPISSFVLALLAGAVALAVVAWLMNLLAQLQSKGNVELRNAVGLTAEVYLRVPPHGEGLGKVTLALQGRTLELKAITHGPELPTGTSVRVLALQAKDTLQVAALSAA